jgi:hypothetical protein
VTETSHVPLPEHALQTVKVWSKSVNDGHFTLEEETVFRPTSPRHVAEWLKHDNWCSLPMRYKQCKCGGNRSIMKGPLILRPKKPLVPNLPRISTGWLKHHMWHSLPMCYKQCKFGRYGWVKKGTLPWTPTVSRSCLASNCSGVTETWQLVLPTHALQAVQLWSKLVNNEGHFTLEDETVLL